MQLRRELQDRLAEEFRFAANKMGESKDPSKKLYYLSVFFGEPIRILNFQWDRDLALVLLVLQKTHQNVATAFQNYASGAEKVAILPEAFWESLTHTATELANYVETHGDERELCRIMGRFAELSYATTGNGFYLLNKGQITL